MDVRRQHKGPGFARMIAIAALVDGGHVIGIKQVIHIELQIEVAVDPIAQFGVGNPVALGVIRGTDCTIAAPAQASDIAHTAADGQIAGGLILRPQRKGMFRGVGQGGRSILCNVLSLRHCRMLLSVAGDNRPVRGQVSGRGEFIPLHALFAVLRPGSVIVGGHFVFNIGAE